MAPELRATKCRRFFKLLKNGSTFCFPIVCSFCRRIKAYNMQAYSGHVFFAEKKARLLFHSLCVGAPVKSSGVRFESEPPRLKSSVDALIHRLIDSSKHLCIDYRCIEAEFLLYFVFSVFVLYASLLYVCTLTFCVLRNVQPCLRQASHK
jgi:hypothetical protein